MTDTTISDAVAWPQDDGTGVSDGDEDYNSAAYHSLLAKYRGQGSYVAVDTGGNATLQFNDVDTTNEEVDVGAGFAYIMESGHSVQSGSQTTYDTSLPNSAPYVAILPTEVTNLGLGTDNVNDLWLAIDPTTNSDPVYIRHGNGLSAPSDPNVKLGTVNTSTGSTTRANDGAQGIGGNLSDSGNDTDGGDNYQLPAAADNIDLQSDGELLNTQTAEFSDESADPANNGEIQRNSTDLKAFSGGAVRNFSDIGSGGLSTNTVSSNTTTSDEDLIAVNTSGGAVTITLASADVTNGNSILIVHVDGSNAITVDTESSETIDPDGDSSKTINNAGDAVRFTGDGTNWDASLAPEFDSMTADLIIDAGTSRSTPPDIISQVGWEEDGNSPQTVTGTGSDTFTLNGTFDFVLVHAEIEDTSGSSQDIDLQINGDTGANYNFVDLGNSRTTGANEVTTIQTVAGNGTTPVEFLHTGRWSGRWRWRQIAFNSGTGFPVAADNQNVTSPLDSITLASSGNMDISWTVYGKDIGGSGEP